MFVVSLCAVNVQPAQSQSLGTVYIDTDGTVYSTANVTVPIQQDGTVYTFTDDLVVSAFGVLRSNIVVDGAGFTLSGSGEAGIDLSYAYNVTIKDVYLAGMFLDGIYISESSSHTITGCTIESNGNGISLYNTAYNNITGNIIRGNDVGIYLLESSDNLFRNNQLDNTHDINVYGTTHSHYINDMDYSNTIRGSKKVYYLVNEDNLFISPDTYPDVGYLALVSCSNMTVYGLTLTRNAQGLLLASSTDTTIAQCEITENYVGIMLFASSGNIIGENTITENTRGIQLSMFSGSNNIFSNTIKDNRGGIFLFNSSQNVFTENNITNNDSYGIGFSASSYNIIRNNFFIDNGMQVIDSINDDPTIPRSINTWSVSYPVGGNYWSDYTGVDVKSGTYQNETGADQLGDTPYIIDTSNKDSYPRMLYGSAPVVTVTSPGNTTYSETSLTLSYSVSEEASWVKYSLDGATNVTISGPTTLSDLSSGMHRIILYAEDMDGNQGTSGTIYFTISTGTTSEEPFPTWILAIIIVAVVAVILFFFVRIIRKK
jgi:parallel beta-helix repeat protein